MIKKSKLKKVIIELLTFIGVILLLKFRRSADGPMMTWRELLSYTPLIIIALIAINIRNSFIFSNTEDIEDKTSKNDNDEE